jgi:hypothetical protein
LTDESDYVAHDRHPAIPHDHEEAIATTTQKTTDEAFLAKTLALVPAESRADAGPLRLDHTHGAR